VDDDAVDEWVGGAAGGSDEGNGSWSETSGSENTSEFEWSTDEEG